jgi:hypothetical protein
MENGRVRIRHERFLNDRVTAYVTINSWDLDTMEQSTLRPHTIKQQE